VSDELGINVQGGDPLAPGFTAQRSTEGITLGAGAYSAGPVGFGIANDEGGLSVNAFSTVPSVYTLHYFRPPGEATLDFTAPRPPAELLVIGGGGSGGGGARGGGGGAGQVIHERNVALPASTAVTVGAGGEGGLCHVANGDPTIFGDLYTALGGGHGAGYATYFVVPDWIASASGGANGGGGVWIDEWTLGPVNGATGSPGFQGGNGRQGDMYGHLGDCGGGGGGAGGAGADGWSSSGGAGGPGVYIDIVVHGRHLPDFPTRWGLDNLDWYGGGGTGAVTPHSYYYGGPGGGLGGGGMPGGWMEGPPYPSGRANTGGGGGGSGTWNEDNLWIHVGNAPCYDGASGIVIVRYEGPPRATGGEIEVRRTNDGEVV